MRTILLAWLSAAVAGSAIGADWPMYRSDASRTGYTGQPLPKRLHLAWVHHAAERPRSAWPTRERLPFDRVFQPVVAGGMLFFGSSADDQVYALDAATGDERWTFFTGGPVRMAPLAWKDRLFVVSDDGCLYALRASDGQLLWKLRGGPRGEMLLGNDRMISRWPARGGPVVLDDVLYFGAGLWPSEGIFVFAVDPADGRVLWRNDSSGSIEMNQPHPGARAVSGLSSQGHFVAAGSTLLVPTGRAVPAALDRGDGRFRYFHLQANRSYGGSEVVAFDGHFANAGPLFAIDDGRTEAVLGRHVAVHPKWVVCTSPASATTLLGLPRDRLLVSKETVDRKGKPQTIQVLGPPAWTTSLSTGEVDSLIIAGDQVVVGGQNQVGLVEIDSGEESSTTAVPGVVWGLAAADSRLYVSTDQGVILCFDGQQRSEPIVHRAKPVPPPSDPDSAEAKAAEEIVARTGLAEGYCLDLGCGTGRLAVELARRTSLHVEAVDPDAENVRAARRMLARGGLYGVRVTVHQAEPGTLPLPEYFADLVISGRSVNDPAWASKTVEAARCSRPFGGITLAGPSGAMHASVRGPLEGAAAWTHQYADPANTLCSSDRLVRGPLAMLWFRDTDLFMPSRHGRGPAPLVDRGRMFVEGVDGLRAVNAYNGRTLWECPLPGILRAYHQEHLMGTAGTGSNYCLGGDRVFIHNGKACLVLDVATGRNLARIDPPSRPDGKPSTWGLIAYEDGVLFGSLADTEHLSQYRFLRSDMSEMFTESRVLFAADPAAGKILWTHAPRHAIRHNAVAIGSGRVYLIDRPLAEMDEARYSARTPEGKRQYDAAGAPPHKPGRVVALEAKTGKVLWESPEDAFGTMLALSPPHDVLLECYQSTRFALDSEKGGRMAALRASDGKLLWDVQADYASRPILNDRTIYAQPGAWDLLTGKRLSFDFQRSYGCGILAGSSRMLVFRSATIGYFDLEGDRVTRNYGGIRPGCWVNAIPAGGIVLMADAASWCTCSYLNQATIALKPQ